MKKRIVSMLLCAAMLAALLCACQGETPQAQPAAQTDMQKPAFGTSLPPAEMLAAATAPDAALAEDAALAALSFAAETLRRTQGENRLLSPVSILCALGMVLEGAEGETRAQMEAALGVSGETLRAFLGPWLSALAAQEDGALHAADGIWLADLPDLHISEDFLERNRTCYGAAVEKCPFDAAALERINDFVKLHTHDRIEKILEELSGDAVMVLVNALAFEADWAEPYTENRVLPGEFRPEGGKAREVTFLHSSERVWLEDENTTGFLKYYEGGRYAFAALLPAEGLKLEDYVSSFTGEKLLKLLENAESDKVITATPKFETSCDFQLGELLQSMGMTDAFDPERADFSALGKCDGGENLYISRVVHKTFLKLDEKGTEAGAATAVEIMKATAVLTPTPPPHRVILDRPFVYLLLDTETNIPLFIGTVDSVG